MNGINNQVAETFLLPGTWWAKERIKVNPVDKEQKPVLDSLEWNVKQSYAR